MKTIKIIDLLNKIANGEEIKAFKFDNYIFKYDMDRENWKNENADVLSNYCNVEECLNNEVEILEEEKKIPEKLGYQDNADGTFYLNRKKYNSEPIKILSKKMNEIIDYLDYLKNKGDE